MPTTDPIPQVDNFSDLLAWARTNRPASVQTLKIALDNARTDELLEVSGLLIYVESTTDANVSLGIRQNEINNGLITLTQSYGAVFPFYRLFLTNTAQPGKTITLTISQASPFQIVDNRSAQQSNTLLTNIQADTDALKAQAVGPGAGTYGADVATGAAAKVVAKAGTITAFRIFADIANTAPVYLGFDNGVLATKKIIALQPGMMWGEDNLKADIWAYSAAAQKISVSQW